MKKTKKMKEMEKILSGKGEIFSIEEAVEILEKFPKAKFDESVEVHVKTAIDPKKSDQQIRGALSLPAGIGKTVRVAALTSIGQKEAKEAGADLVGGEELIDEIKTSGKIDFDVAVATPEMMPKLAKIAKLLGPRGLMPNPKSQTVGPKVGLLVAELKKGKLSFKSDDSGNIHLIIGKRSFEKEKLAENLKVFLDELKKMKPESVKGTFIQSVTICGTMTQAVKVKF